MAAFNDYASQIGADLPKLGKTDQEAKSSFYEHSLGNYSGIVLGYTERWVDDKKKEVEPNTPNATSNGFVKIAITEDPEGAIIDKNFRFLEGEKYPYGRLFFQQFVSHEATFQFQNQSLFADFYIEGVPEASVIESGDNKSFKVHFTNFAFYIGAPVKFTLTKTTKKGEAKRAFVEDGFKMNDHKLDKDRYARRKAVVALLKSQLDERKKTEDTQGENEVAPDVDSSGYDALGGGYTQP